MVVNEGKTEVTVFSRAAEPTLIDLVCGGKLIPSKPLIKALGVVIDHRLRWTDHIRMVVNKVRRLICGFRMIRNKFTEVQAKNLVTAQALSVLYYGSTVLLTPNMLGDRIRRIESIHYRCLRVIVKDYRQRISRVWIDAATQRLPPKKWCRFAAASLAIKVRKCQAPRYLNDELFKNTYTEVRKPGRLFGYDSSKSMTGRAITKNWIGQTLGQIQASWTNSNLSNDQIRRMLKQTFK